MTEKDEMKKIINWCKQQHKAGNKDFSYIYHINNEDAQIDAKQIGIRSGVPDFHLPKPKGKYHGMFIELKTVEDNGISKKGALSSSQALWLNALRKNGYFTCVCYGADAAINALKSYVELKDGQSMPFGDFVVEYLPRRIDMLNPCRICKRHSDCEDERRATVHAVKSCEKKKEYINFHFENLHEAIRKGD